ncbi:hypothetical protein DS843_24565 [Roseomonas genomospecies 6]|uniref:Uncharacterized protein n=1 Tax=Roseomonas genomospecies 6 TaxID=214106 RepID=A0A9W7KPU6_9PROT|nr:hypothetical protein DS843_24565 [Roseomonas genomospecies 6]
MFPAYRADRVFLAVPRSVELASRADQSPDFFLEFFSDENAPDDDQSLSASLHMGLVRGGDHASLRDDPSLFPTGSAPNSAHGPVVFPASLAPGATWYFECGAHRASAPATWDGAQRAALDVRLPAKTADLLYAQLAQGTLVSARMALECAVAGFLPMVAATATFDPGVLIAHLRALHHDAPSLPFGDLVAALERPAGLVGFEAAEPGIPTRDRALALAGRLLRHFGGPAPCPRVSDGPHVALRPPPEGTGPLRWDLRTPFLMEMPQLLALDPFAPIVAAGGRDRVTAFTRVGPLPEDRLTMRVAVASGFPANIRNCDAIDVTLRVDKSLSRSGMTTAQAVTLDPGDRRSQTVALAFRKGTGQAYSARLTLVVDGEVLEFPWFDGPGGYLHLGPADSPLDILTVRAAPALLAQADIAVAVTGTPHTAGLTPDQPSASVLLRPGGDHRLAVTARDRRGKRPPIHLDLPGQSVSSRPVELDLWSFPGYGPQTVRVHVAFSPGVREARFEFRREAAPDDADGSVILDVTPEQPTASVHYVSDHLFDNRYRHRRLLDGGGATAWSDGLPPGEDLELAATETHDTGRTQNVRNA